MSMIEAAKAVLGHTDFVIIGADQVALNTFLPPETDDPEILPRREQVSAGQLSEIVALAAQMDDDTAAQAKREAVNAERERRIAAGATVTVTGAGAIPVQGREPDVRNLQGLGLMALARVAAGDTATVTTFRDALNVDHDLTPPQVLELVQQAAAAAEAIIQASWAIKAMDPLPEDVTADELWPTG